MKLVSILKLQLLLQLREGKKYGYELMKGSEILLGKKISPSQIYPFLSELQKSRLIKIVKRSARDKKLYSLTEKGKIFSENTLQRLDSMFALANRDRIKKCAHCGCFVYGKSFIKSGKHFCCGSCASNF